MFRLILIIGVTILLLMAGVASARARAQPGMFARPTMGRPLQRLAPAREERQEAQRGSQAAAQRAGQVPPTRPEGPGNAVEQRPGHLSPEERKALRRQIDEARDVYRPLPPRRP
ncbi:MAG: hypothetical protein ABSF50_06620 [Burkholderiaceae bacterium]|jgi:hypothetical protein